MTWASSEPAPLLDPEDHVRPFMRACPSAPAQLTNTKAPFHFIAATFNTLSLADPNATDKGKRAGLHDCVGRVALLDSSLVEHGVILAGLQETRTPEGRFRSRHYVRYCSGCLEKRAFGVELWIGSGDGFPAHQAVVLYHDVTRLVARVSVAGARLCVLVGHAPHRGHSVQARSEWWRETKRVCSKAGFDAPWVLCVDGNCSVGSVGSSSVGDLHAEEEDEQVLFSMTCLPAVEHGSRLPLRTLLPVLGAPLFTAVLALWPEVIISLFLLRGVSLVPGDRSSRRSRLDMPFPIISR